MDITMTATIRPQIIRRTLESFNNFMFGVMSHSTRLIVNVDPIGENLPVSSVLDVARPYFQKVFVFSPTEANFPAAIKRVWKATKSKYVFHLEDDWQLIRPIDIYSVVDTMERNPDLALLRLPLWKSEGARTKQWNKWFPWNGEFFVCPRDMRGGLGFSGNPSLIRKAFLDQVEPLLTEDCCPEKQIKWRTSKTMEKILSRWNYGVYQSPNEEPAVMDIGRLWRGEKRFAKNGSYTFTTWVKNDV